MIRSATASSIDRRVLEDSPSWAINAPEFDEAYAHRVAQYYGMGSGDLTLCYAASRATLSRRPIADRTAVNVSSVGFPFSESAA